MTAEKLKISGLIEKLDEIKLNIGDLDVLCFQHEGGNSLRGYVDFVDPKHFVLDMEKQQLFISGWCK